MRRRRVLLDPDAREDLKEIHRWIEMQGSPKSATAYIRRIQVFANSLDIAPERGKIVSGVGERLRIVSFEGVRLAIKIDRETVTVLRVFHWSQDWLKQLRRDAERKGT